MRHDRGEMFLVRARCGSAAWLCGKPLAFRFAFLNLRRVSASPGKKIAVRKVSDFPHSRRQSRFHPYLETMFSYFELTFIR